MKIAVLLTVYNRKDKTLSCLQSVMRQKLPPGVRLDVYVTDDNSSDGTADALRAHFPAATILQGTGSLFWAGGMRHTWRSALKGCYDHYLLLNDDTVLHDHAIDILLSYNNRMTGAGDRPALCIGSTCGRDGRLTYGGRKLRSRFAFKHTAVYNEHQFAECDLGNANIMLVPQHAVDTIGILSETFTHGIADFDYTLRARRAGLKVLVAPGFLGTCVNDHGRNWKSADVPLKERIRYLKNPRGLAYSEYLFFIRRHFPLSYPSAFIKLWMKTLFPVLWDTFRK